VKGSSTVFVDFSFNFKDILRFMYDVVQVIDFSLFPCYVLVIYLDECCTKTLDGINRCVFSDFIDEWCDVFVNELIDLFVNYRCGWSRSACKALATMEDSALTEDRL